MEKNYKNVPISSQKKRTRKSYTNLFDRMQTKL